MFTDRSGMRYGIVGTTGSGARRWVLAAALLGIAAGPRVRRPHASACARAAFRKRCACRSLILIVIYFTFLAPSLASFVMAMLAWHGMKGAGAGKMGQFALMIPAASGRLTLLFLNSFRVRQPLLPAFLSTGQFCAETLVMAAHPAWL
jgi:hypothetical protein